MQGSARGLPRNLLRWSVTEVSGLGGIVGCGGWRVFSIVLARGLPQDLSGGYRVTFSCVGAVSCCCCCCCSDWERGGCSCSSLITVGTPAVPFFGAFPSPLLSSRLSFFFLLCPVSPNV